MNIRQPPWYQDKKTQAELYNNKNPSQQVDTTPTLVPRGGVAKKYKKVYTKDHLNIHSLKIRSLVQTRLQFPTQDHWTTQYRLSIYKPTESL